MWDGERLQYTHRLSYEAFVGVIPAGLDVLHRCDRPGCVEPLHLWCGTHAENMADKMAKGRGGHDKLALKLRGRPSHQRGSKSVRADLEEDQVRDIVRRLRAPRDGQQDRPASLAREYGVSDSLIRGIRSGRNWGWLTRMIAPAPLDRRL